MKKIVMVVIALGIISTNAFAGWVTNTTVEQVLVSNANITVVFANPNGGNFSPKTLYGSTPDDKKVMVAAILTAKSTGATVDVFLNATTFSKLYIK